MRMRLRLLASRRAAALCPPALLLLALAACFHYVEEGRPARPEDCPPDPPLRLGANGPTYVGSAGIVSGRVVDADAGQPLPATVHLVGRGRGREAATDTAGTFRFDSMAPGRYVLRTRRVGYRQRQDTADVDPTAGRALVVRLEPAALTLCPGGVWIVTRTRRWGRW